MFYSHEVLTSRKYGVATVWLVATLGQKSTARKVTRRAILDVDVPKACETVITSEVPMALRLQSSLLFGISRVYSQQCGYVLADAQHAQNSIRTLLRVVRASQLDSGTAQARPDQITLQDDPAFVPGLTYSFLGSDLLDLDIGGVGPRYISDTTSLRTAESQQIPSQIGLQLPSSSSLDIGGGFMLPGSGSHEPRPSSLLDREVDDILLPDVDIGLDADGNFIELDDFPQGILAGSSHRSLLPSESSWQGGVRHERRPGHLGSSAALTGKLPDALPLIDDGYNRPALDSGNFSDGFHPPQELFDMADTSGIAAAPQRRKTRTPKIIPLDRNIELRNRDLLAMNTGYMTHMTEEWNRIVASKATAQAKKNADYWLLGKGIAGVGNALGRMGTKGPLAALWSGDNLYVILTGSERSTKGKKRVSGHENDDADRRVRQRLDNDQPTFREEDDTLMGNYDLEVGREGQAPLEELSSAMPWNISASLRGSSVPRSAAGGASIPGSAARSLARRGSRMISASPLVDKDVAFADGLTSDAPGFGDLGGFLGDDEFELYGPGAGVDTQTAGQSQWQKAVLDQESNNFLGFIEAAIDEKRAAAETTGLVVEELYDIEFEELLPPVSNSRTVAAQALLHVLTLGTKNLIRVMQREAFASIVLQVC